MAAEPDISTPSSLFDSHPSTASRLALIAKLPEHPVDPDERPAWSLLTDATTTAPALEAALLADNPDERASWDEVIARAGAYAATKDAAILASAARGIGLPDARLSTIVATTADDGGLRRLTTHVVGPLDDLDPDDVDEAMSAIPYLLTRSAIAGLIAADRARYELDWGGPWKLTIDGTRVDEEELTRRAGEERGLISGLVADYRLGNYDCGLTTTLRPQLGAVQTAVKCNGEIRDLLVCSTGLLLVPTQRDGALSRGVAAAVSAGNRRERDRMQDVLNAPLDELINDPRNTYLADEVLAGAQIALRPWGWTITVRCVDDRELSIRPTVSGEEFGEVLDAMEELFGHRWGR